MSNQRNNQRRNNNNRGGGGGNRNRNHNNNRNRNHNNRNRDQNRDRNQSQDNPPADKTPEKSTAPAADIDARDVVFRNTILILLLLGSVLFIRKWTGTLEVFGYEISGFAVGMTGLVVFYLVISFWFLRRVRE